MLHLAQVKNKDGSGKAELHLLAYQISDYAWTVLKASEQLSGVDIGAIADAQLVLVELTETKDVLTIQDAKDWVLDIMRQFLLTGITPSFLRQETVRAEQWRQELTLESQEVNRRSLELEARREQIQELEASLQRDKKQLELIAVQCMNQNEGFEKREHHLQQEEEALKLIATQSKHQIEELEKWEQRLRQQEETLELQRQQLQLLLSSHAEENPDLTS